MLTEFVIDRKRWLRGEEESVLLRSVDGKMCCLGFMGLACGATPPVLRNRRTPGDAAAVAWPAWMLESEDASSDTAFSLMAINDNLLTSDAEKEAQIIAIMAKHGVTVRFVDEAPSC